MEIPIEAALGKMRMDCEGQIDIHWFVLPDAINPVGALIFNRRVPPAAEMNDVVCGRQRQTHPARLGRQDHDIELPSRPSLELVNPLLSLITAHAAADPKRWSPKPIPLLKVG